MSQARVKYYDFPDEVEDAQDIVKALVRLFVRK